MAFTMTSNIDRVPFVSNRKARGCSAELFMGSFRVKLAFNPCIRVPHTKSFHEPPSYDASLRCDDIDQTCLVLQFLLFACGVCAWPQKHWPQILGPKRMMHIFHRIWPISYHTSEKQLPPPGLVPKILPGNSPPITTYHDHKWWWPCLGQGCAMSSSSSSLESSSRPANAAWALKSTNPVPCFQLSSK